MNEESIELIEGVATLPRVGINLISPGKVKMKWTSWRAFMGVESLTPPSHPAVRSLKVTFTPQTASPVSSLDFITERERI